MKKCLLVFTSHTDIKSIVHPHVRHIIPGTEKEHLEIARIVCKEELENCRKDGSNPPFVLEAWVPKAALYKAGGCLPV